MESGPAGRRDDPPDLTGDTPCSDSAAAARPLLLFPLLTLATAFGLAAAGVAVFRSGRLGAAREEIAGGNGNWLLSALTIAVIAALWLAGLVCLIRVMMPGNIGARATPSGWTKTLAAFALGPVLMVVFFAALSLIRHPTDQFAAYPVVAAALLVLVFARRLLRLLATRLLLCFFLWLAILVAPAFWRDEVSAQLSDFTFRPLAAAGLLN